MWILLEPNAEWAVGDEILETSGFWVPIRDENTLMVLRVIKHGSVSVRRRLTGWEAVKHAIRTEIWGNNKEGCETTSYFWDCECEGDPLHLKDREGYSSCPRCHCHQDSQPDSRKADVLLKIIEEKSS